MRKQNMTSLGAARAAMKRRREEVAAKMRDWASQARNLSESQLAFIRQNAFRTKMLVVIFSLLFSALAGRAYYLATDSFIRSKADMVLLNTELSSASALARESERLSRLASRLENVSLGELREILANAASLAERASRDFKAQYSSWSALRGKIKEDSSTYESLRVQLAELQRLQNEEILRLKQMLDAAQKPSIFADAMNLTLSFALGVLSSLLASGVYTWWQERRARAA
jgi:hypothetical protein